MSDKLRYGSQRFAVFILLTIIGLMLAFPGMAPALAQDSSTIKYGDVAKGKITAAATQVKYSFTGKKGDYLFATMQVDFATDKASRILPELGLQSATGDVLADPTKLESVVFFRVPGAAILAKLPADGDYTLIARTYDLKPENTGAFILTLNKLDPLVANQAVTGTLAPERDEKYLAAYVVESAVPFAVSYERPEGKFTPVLSINKIGKLSHKLAPVASLSGTDLSFGSLGVSGSEGVYLITLSGSTNDKTVTSSYKLTFQPKSS